MAYRTHLRANRGLTEAKRREERLNDNFTSIYGIKERTNFKETIV